MEIVNSVTESLDAIILIDYNKQNIFSLDCRALWQISSFPGELACFVSFIFNLAFVFVAYSPFGFLISIYKEE